jgi:stage II sporulation protein AA (anti-sigma F factor antagonist)
MVGVELCQMAGAKRLCLFHHDPVCDDDRLMDIQRDTRRLEELTRNGAELEVIAAYDGLELILESSSNQQKKENDMEIQARKEAQATVVTIAGRMDAVTAPEYEKKLNELMAAEENRFVVDFAQLDYISSAGLRALLATAKRLKTTNGQIRFANVNGTVKEIFDISGFGSIFQMDDSVAAALSTMA